MQCGNELSAGARFCGKCGKDQLAGQNQCPNCGKELEENEKFCAGCGTPVGASAEPRPEPQKQTPPEHKEEKFTKEGRKIISGGPKSALNKQVSPPTPPINTQPKKKKGCRGCAISSIIILAVLVVLIMLLYNRVSDWWHNYKAEQGIELNTEGVDGIVDIEEGDVGHLPENRNEQQNNSQSNPSAPAIQKNSEAKDLKTICDEVEEAFVNADAEKIKSLLTDQSKTNYANLLDDIEPYLKEYANCFKTKKLIAADDYFALYSLKDENGTELTVEFALSESGDWKLVRF